MKLLTDKEIEALEKTAQLKFYKDYVEPLEKERDELADEVDDLKEKLRTSKMHISRLQNKIDRKPIENTQDDFTRLRNQNIAIKNKLDDARRVLDRKDREIVGLKIEIHKLKEAISKRGGQ